MLAARVRRPAGAAGLADRLNATFIRWPLVFIAVMAVLYGGGRSDYRDFVQFAVNPLDAALPADKQFLYSSPLNLWIATALSHICRPAVAYALTASLAIVVVALAWRAYATSFAPDSRQALLFVVFSTPILLVATKWVGKGDLFLIAAYLLALSRRGTGWLSAAAACVMILAHREIGSIVLASHCFLRRQVKVPLVAGAGAGLAVMYIYQYGILPPVAATRGAIILSRGGEIIGLNAMQPVAHVLFGYGWFWMFVVMYLQKSMDWRSLVFLPFAFGLAFLTIDYTRDLILLSMPLVLLTAEWVAKAEQNIALSPIAMPFPLLFLIQMQFLKCDVLVDTNWPSMLVH